MLRYILVRMGKAKYVWVTLIPGIILAGVTLWAAYINITVNYLPKGLYLMASLSAVVMVLVLTVMLSAGRRLVSLNR